MRINLKHQPASNHPHWDAVLDHCGQFVEIVEPCPGFTNGGDYLRLWISCLIRHPDEKLPYLFLVGPQNAGKSILHEAIALLIHGVASLDQVLRNKEFTPAWAILGYIDEVPAHKYSGRLERMVNGGMHIIQCASDPRFCPLLPNDPRVTVLEVPALSNEIPKATLLPQLNAEAPQFMRTLMDLELPEPGNTGFRLPRVATNEVQFTV